MQVGGSFFIIDYAEVSSQGGAIPMHFNLKTMSKPSILLKTIGA